MLWEYVSTHYEIFVIEHCCAGVSRAGARTGLQLPGHGDMQGFDSSSPANRFLDTQLCMHVQYC